MLETLVASRPRRQSNPVVTAVAVGIHGLVFMLCVIGTRSVVKPVTRPVEDTTLVFLPRLAPAVVDKPPPPGRGGGGGGEGLQVLVGANPPPRGFQVVNAVGDIPSIIPPVAPGERALDPRDFSGKGIEGGTGWGVVGGTGSPDQDPFDAGAREALYSATSTEARFATAELLVQPVFDYPRVLRDAGVEGRVMVEFIIDTLGLVEPGSIKVLKATHSAFSESARAGILAARFKPARLGERPVRQLSRMPVSFTVQVSRPPIG
jgi:protein TonB